MLEAENIEDYIQSCHFDFDQNESFSLFSNMEQNFNNEELKLLCEENLFYSFKINNKFKKKDIIFNIQKNQNRNKKVIQKTYNNEIKNKKIIDFKLNTKKFSTNILSNVIYRKDAYYKHFKVNLGKYIKNRVNSIKNKCFPFFSRNNFSSPNYKYTGNPKEKDNFIFLSFKIKDILIKDKDKTTFNRQYNNDLLISFIEKNEEKAIDKNAYKELIQFLNEKLEDVIIQFYDDEKEYKRINQDQKSIYFDQFYKRDTGISLLEKYGFVKALKKKFD